MKYLRIRNFEKFQHYKDRNPPWIKLYTALLDDIDFLGLDDDLKWPVVGLFLLASRLDNKIPCNAKYLQNRLGVKKIDITRLLHSTFIETAQDASNMLAESKQGATDANFPLVPPCIPPNPLRETETQRRAETGASAPEPILVFGEFQLVRLTADEHAKLKLKLNGHTDDYINRLDRWGKDQPGKFAKRKSHYATLLTWFDRDVKDGKVVSSSGAKRPSEAEIQEAQEKSFGLLHRNQRAT